MSTIWNFFSNQKRLIVILLIILLGLLGSLFLVKFPDSFFGAKIKDYKTQTVSRGNLSTTITASGQIEAEHRATLGFLTSGRIAWVGFKEGDLVEKGQVITALDNQEARIDISRAEANLKSTKSLLEKILDDARLWRYGNSWCEICETQTQKTAREQAEMTRDIAYQDLQKAKKALEWSFLIAPFDGTIVEIKGIAVNQNITPSSGLITISDTNNLKFIASVDETEFSSLIVGQKGEIILDAYPNEKLSGSIGKIGVVAIRLSTGGSVIPVEVSLPIDRRLKSGLNGEANFTIVSKKGVLIIPRVAIRKENGNQYIFVLVKDRAEKRTVSVGESLGGMTEIVSGLKEGEKVILGDIKQ